MDTLVAIEINIHTNVDLISSHHLDRDRDSCPLTALV